MLNKNRGSFAIIILLCLPFSIGIQSSGGSKRSASDNELLRVNHCDIANSLKRYDVINALRCMMNGFRETNFRRPANLAFPSLSANELQANIFQALSSVAQYDEFKCVARILCEMTSGSVLSGTYRQMPDILQNLGQNTLIGLLTGFGATQTSPFIHFSKAALLGYINRGNSDICYREYPKCPRNQDQLIHYLNNYNGGLFRFFNGAGLSGSEQQQHYPSYFQQGTNGGYFKNGRKNAAQTIVFASEPEDRTGRGELKFDKPVFNAYHDNKKDIFTRQPEQRGDSKRIIFPIHDQLEEQAVKESPFFPEELQNEHQETRYPFQ